MTLEEKKKTKMQCKKNDHGVCSPALQVKNHVHQILYSTQFRRGQKSPIPLRGLDDLSGLFSSDILRFLQVQPQVSSTDIKTVRRDFPGGPVVETQRSQCRGCTFDPCSGNWDPTCRASWPKKNFFFLIKKKKKVCQELELEADSDGDSSPRVPRAQHCATGCTTPLSLRFHFCEIK